MSPEQYVRPIDPVLLVIILYLSSTIQDTTKLKGIYDNQDKQGNQVVEVVEVVVLVALLLTTSTTRIAMDRGDDLVLATVGMEG